MYLTDEEASKKWCPLARALLDMVSGPSQSACSYNRKDTNVNCIASKCMAWRADGISSVGFCGAFGHPVGKQTQ
ncbi:MAG: hypothetical protein ABSB95_05765 [Dissulfurispiraceae bacterium]|jgi:hypothetical protein